MMVVLGGSVRISAVFLEGKELILNIIETGGIVGEIALIDGKVRSMDATAIGTCRLKKWKVSSPLVPARSKGKQQGEVDPESRHDEWVGDE